MHALCHSQVVHYDDVAAEEQVEAIPPSLKARIFLARAHPTANCAILVNLAAINSSLDLLIEPSGGTDDDARSRRHLLVAEAVAIKFPKVLVNRNSGSEQFKGYYYPCFTPVGDEFLRGTERGNEAADILCGAIVLGDLGLVKPLLEKGDAEVNEEAPHFGRPLQVAAAWGHADIVQHLLDQGADARAVRWDGEIRPWDWAEWPEYNNHTAQIQRGYEPSPPFQSRQIAFSALFAAMLGGHEAIVRCLMREEHRLPAASREYYRAIIAGARTGRLDLIQLLIHESGLSLMEHHSDLAYIMMLEASEHGQASVIKYLLANGMWIRPPQKRDASTWGRSRSGWGRSKWSTRGWSDLPLAVAADRGNERLLRFAVDRGQDPNMLTIRGSPHCPLMAAASRGHEHIVELLLEYSPLPRDITLAYVAGVAGAAGEERLVRRILKQHPQLLGIKGLPKPKDRAVNCIYGQEEYYLEEHTTLGEFLLIWAIKQKNPRLIKMLVQEAGVPLEIPWDTRSPELRIPPVVTARRESADWICDLLISLGAQDYEVPCVDYDKRFHAEYSGRCGNSKLRLGGYLGAIGLSKRTWDWIGRH